MSAILLQRGQTLPSPVSGLGLIDTGASVTCIDDSIAKQLNLPVIDVVPMSSASHANTQQNVYPLQIEVIGLPITLQAPRAVGANLGAQGLALLIGRDVLQHCTVFYNGITGQITVCI